MDVCVSSIQDEIITTARADAKFLKRELEMQKAIQEEEKAKTTPKKVVRFEEGKKPGKISRIYYNDGSFEESIVMPEVEVTSKRKSTLHEKIRRAFRNPNNEKLWEWSDSVRKERELKERQLKTNTSSKNEKNDLTSSSKMSWQSEDEKVAQRIIDAMHYIPVDTSSTPSPRVVDLNDHFDTVKYAGAKRMKTKVTIEGETFNIYIDIHLSEHSMSYEIKPQKIKDFEEFNTYQRGKSVYKGQKVTIEFRNYNSGNQAYDLISFTIPRDKEKLFLKYIGL